MWILTYIHMNKKYEKINEDLLKKLVINDLHRFIYENNNKKLIDSLND